MDLSCTTLG